MIKDLQEEFHSSFWSYVRTGEGETGDDRSTMVSGIADLSPEHLTDFMKPADVAAIISVCVVVDTGATIAGLGAEDAHDCWLLVKDKVLMRSENPKISALLDALRTGEEDYQMFYVAVALCLAWGSQQPQMRVHIRGERFNGQ